MCIYNRNHRYAEWQSTNMLNYRILIRWRWQRLLCISAFSFFAIALCGRVKQASKRILRFLEEGYQRYVVGVYFLQSSLHYNLDIVICFHDGFYPRVQEDGNVRCRGNLETRQTWLAGQSITRSMFIFTPICKRLVIGFETLARKTIVPVKIKPAAFKFLVLPGALWVKVHSMSFNNLFGSFKPVSFIAFTPWISDWQRLQLPPIHTHFFQNIYINLCANNLPWHWDVGSNRSTYRFLNPPFQGVM